MHEYCLTQIHQRSVDWKRIAEPQDDQYDSNIILQHAGGKNKYASRDDEEKTFSFDGKVAIIHDSDLMPSNCIAAPLDHPNIEKACNLIRLWPSAFIQCQLLLDFVSVFIDTQMPFSGTYGSICGPGKRGFGSIVSTINSDIGFAEAIVHEMAHHKLMALGIQFESANQLFTNIPAQKFRSPIRFDCLRPIPAIFHAQYSYTYISALDVEIINAQEDNETNFRIAKNSLSVNIPKLEFGYKIIKEYADVDDHGADFLNGYFSWFSRVLKESYKIFDHFQIVPNEFVHPIKVEDAVEDSADIPNFSYAKPCQLKDIEEHCLGDEVILYSLTREVALSLNSSAKSIWKLCDGRRNISEISEELSLHFGCSCEDLIPDVESAITELVKLDFLDLKGE